MTCISRRPTSLLATFLLALLLLAGDAEAAEISPEYDYDKKLVALHYEAAAGEVNDLTVEREALEYRFRDRGAEIIVDPRTRCRVNGGGDVTCPPGKSYRITLSLGDQDDEAKLPSDDAVGVDVAGGPGSDRLKAGGSEYQTVSGGPGNDVVVGSRGENNLYGGGGEDRLEGGGGPDLLSGGPGSDVLRGGRGGDLLEGDTPYDRSPRRIRPVADVLDGGGGSDTASYYNYRERVRVDLRQSSPNGRPGEGDRLVSIEDAVGGGGDDVLIGDDGDNVLDSSSGQDTLRGGAGDDLLDGSEGFHRLDGGPGNDSLKADYDVEQERNVRCGSGRDTVIEPDGIRLFDSCEHVGFGESSEGYFQPLCRLSAQPIRVERTSLVFKVRCLAGEQVRLNVTGPAPSPGEEGRFYGYSRIAAKPRDHDLVDARLNAAGRKAVRNGGTLVITIASENGYASYRISLPPVR